MAVSVLITVAVEESRIAALRSTVLTAEHANRASVVTARETSGKGDDTGAPVRTKHRPEATPGASVKEADSKDDSFAKSIRRMWDNPAGKAMINQQTKMMVSMTYQDFVDGLKLSKEEGDYFKNLLGKDFADQQELGMKLMGASEDERKTLTDELARRGKENEEEIRKFLNSDEDFKSYTDYKNHLPERQQLDGLRAAMTNKGAPLDPDAESRLIDAMYRVRTESKAPDLSGPGALDELAKGNMVANFEKNWDVQQETLQTEAGKILNETQMTAFKEYQKQLKEMQLMGLKMAEKMMSGKNGKQGTE